MSHVLDIRRRTAQERLRNDHIDMLYQMETLSKENSELLSYIQRLEQQLESATKSQQQPQTKDVASQEIKEKRNDEFMKLQKDYQLLENELKTLKTTLSLNGKMRSQHAQELQVYEQELTQRDKLINEIVSMSSEDFQGMRQRDCERYQKIILNQDELIQQLNQGMKIVTVDSNNKQTKEASREMERRCDVLQIDLQKLSQKHSELKISYEELESRYQQNYSQLLHFQQAAAAQQLQLMNSSCQTDSPPFITAPPFADAPLEELPSSSDDLDIRSITPDTTTVDISLPPCYSDLDRAEKEDEVISPRGGKDFSFQEFIRLKRENLSLRLMLANTTNSNSNPNQRMGSSASPSRASSLYPPVQNSLSSHHSPTHPYSASSVNSRLRVTPSGKMNGGSLGRGHKRLSSS